MTKVCVFCVSVSWNCVFLYAKSLTDQVLDGLYDLILCLVVCLTAEVLAYMYDFLCINCLKM